MSTDTPSNMRFAYSRERIEELKAEARKDFVRQGEVQDLCDQSPFDLDIEETVAAQLHIETKEHSE